MKIRLRLLIILSLICGQFFLRANALAQDSAIPQKAIWDLAVSVATENLAAFLLGVLGCFWWQDKKYRWTASLDTLSQEVRDNKVLLKRLLKHFDVKSDASDV